MCVLVEAVVCARPYEQERAFSYRINCTSMHLYFHSWTEDVVSPYVSNENSKICRHTKREAHCLALHLHTVLENLLDYQKCFAGKNIHMVEVN